MEKRQQLLLFIILLNCLLIKSYTLIYPPMNVNLEFYFSEKFSGTNRIRVTTRLIPKNDTRCVYHLSGEKMNDYTLNIKSVERLNFQRNSKHCIRTFNGMYINF